jgi:hypothetical protein
LQRGTFTGSIAEHELHAFGTERAFSAALGQVADGIIARMPVGSMDRGRVDEIRSAGIAWVRDWQERFPAADAVLDLDDPITPLLLAQTDLFVRRPDRPAIRVRPDQVVSVGDTVAKLRLKPSSRACSLVAPSPGHRRCCGMCG